MSEHDSYISEEADAADAALEEALEPPRDVLVHPNLARAQRLALFRERSVARGVVLHDCVCK